MSGEVLLFESSNSAAVLMMAFDESISPVSFVSISVCDEKTFCASISKRRHSCMSCQSNTLEARSEKPRTWPVAIGQKAGKKLRADMSWYSLPPDQLSR